MNACCTDITNIYTYLEPDQDDDVDESEVEPEEVEEAGVLYQDEESDDFVPDQESTRTTGATKTGTSGKRIRARRNDTSFHRDRWMQSQNEVLHAWAASHVRLPGQKCTVDHLDGVSCMKEAVYRYIVWLFLWYSRSYEIIFVSM